MEVKDVHCAWSFHLSRRHVIANPSHSRLFVAIIFGSADEDTELLSRWFKPISVMRRLLKCLSSSSHLPQWGSGRTAVCKSGPLSKIATCRCATKDGSRATRTRRVLSWDCEGRGSRHYHSRTRKRLCCGFALLWQNVLFLPPAPFKPDPFSPRTPLPCHWQAIHLTLSRDRWMSGV